MSLDDYKRNAEIPEVAKMMGRGTPEDEEKTLILQFLAKLLKNPIESARYGVQPEWPPGFAQPNQPPAAPPPQQPNNFLDPNQRPGMKMPGL